MLTSLINTSDNKQLKKIKVDFIERNPAQPRKYFDNEELMELSASIKEYGILNPISVRKKGTRYELIAGERRLRASKLAGLTDIPCIVMTASDEDSSVLAIIENIQRSDLDFFEEALSYKKLIEHFNFTQEDAAKKIGKTQSSVANKLRLLKLSSDNIELIKIGNLTERHARALLRLSSEQDRMKTTQYIIEKQLNVSKTDEYIDFILSNDEIKHKKKSKISYLIKDVRIFMNTIDKSLKTMQSAGIDAIVDRDETDTNIILHISIPKSSNK